MPTNRTDLPPEDLRHFHALRRAARKVYDAYKPVHAQELRLFPGSDTADMMPDAEFIRLLVAVRLVYMQREKANFGRIRGLLHKHGDETVRRRAARMKGVWASALHEHYDFVIIPRTRDARTPPESNAAIVVSQAGDESRRYDPKAVLDLWLNGEVVHQDDDLIVELDRLKRFGASPLLFLQRTVKEMARAILGLDIIVADFLGEPQLPYEEIFGDSVDYENRYAGE